MARQLLIADTNILIDMDVGELLNSMFELEFDFAVPDMVYAEELETNHSDLPARGLHIMELQPAAVETALHLADVYRASGVSRNDLAALALAQHQRCPLITGDAALRTVCCKEHVEVHGTLWLVKHIHDAALADIGAIECAYNKMIAHGRRLPREQVTRQLREFRRQG